MMPRAETRFRFNQAVLGLGALALVACQGSEPSAPATDMELHPPAPGTGVQFKMSSTIAAGVETERCQFVTAPAEGLFINHQEVRYTPGSHHILLYLTPYLSIPQKDEHGQARDTSSVFDCPGGPGGDWALRNVLGGAQSVDGGSLIRLPPDAAVNVPGNAVLMMDAHYLNASSKELVAEARINVYTIPESQVKNDAGVLFFYNPIIRLPAQSPARAHMRCTVGKEIRLANIQSHMHKRAVDFRADLLDPAGKLVETLYTNKEWDNVPVKEFQPPRLIPAGSFLDYQCDYKNPEDRTVIQGPSTRDEMCMLIGSYYPRDEKIEYCMDRYYIGSGDKSCAASLKCTADALNNTDFATLYGCVSDSCSAVGKPLTDALVCLYTRNNGACDAACQNPAASDCASCLSKGCQPQTDACAAASCN